MNRKLLSAYTSFTEAPPYINASLHEDDRVEVIVRGEATVREGGRFPVADCASMKMSREDFINWACEALSNLGIGVKH